MDMAVVVVAGDLASLLASEALCDLTYDLDAIDRFIDDHVPPGAMGFAGYLDLATRAGRMQYAEMEGASLRAHCRAIEATARHLGFIE